jgi:hypothetical protein
MVGTHENVLAFCGKFPRYGGYLQTTWLKPGVLILADSLAQGYRDGDVFNPTR